MVKNNASDKAHKNKNNKLFLGCLPFNKHKHIQEIEAEKIPEIQKFIACGTNEHPCLPQHSKSLEEFHGSSFHLVTASHSELSAKAAKTAEYKSESETFPSSSQFQLEAVYQASNTEMMHSTDSLEGIFKNLVKEAQKIEINQSVISDGQHSERHIQIEFTLKPENLLEDVPQSHQIQIHKKTAITSVQELPYATCQQKDKHLGKLSTYVNSPSTDDGEKDTSYTDKHLTSISSQAERQLKETGKFSCDERLFDGTEKQNIMPAIVSGETVKEQLNEVLEIVVDDNIVHYDLPYRRNVIQTPKDKYNDDVENKATIIAEEIQIIENDSEERFKQVSEIDMNIDVVSRDQLHVGSTDDTRVQAEKQLRERIEEWTTDKGATAGAILPEKVETSPRPLNLECISETNLENTRTPAIYFLNGNIDSTYNMAENIHECSNFKGEFNVQGTAETIFAVVPKQSVGRGVRTTDAPMKKDIKTNELGQKPSELVVHSASDHKETPISKFPQKSFSEENVNFKSQAHSKQKSAITFVPCLPYARSQQKEIYLGKMSFDDNISEEEAELHRSSMSIMNALQRKPSKGEKEVKETDKLADIEEGPISSNDMKRQKPKINNLSETTLNTYLPDDTPSETMTSVKSKACSLLKPIGERDEKNKSSRKITDYKRARKDVKNRSVLSLQEAIRGASDIIIDFGIFPPLYRLRESTDSSILDDVEDKHNITSEESIVIKPDLVQKETSKIDSKDLFKETFDSSDVKPSVKSESNAPLKHYDGGESAELGMNAKVSRDREKNINNSTKISLQDALNKTSGITVDVGVFPPLYRLRESTESSRCSDIEERLTLNAEMKERYGTRISKVQSDVGTSATSLEHDDTSLANKERKISLVAAPTFIILPVSSQNDEKKSFWSDMRKSPGTILRKASLKDKENISSSETSLIYTVSPPFHIKVAENCCTEDSIEYTPSKDLMDYKRWNTLALQARESLPHPADNQPVFILIPSQTDGKPTDTKSEKDTTSSYKKLEERDDSASQVPLSRHIDNWITVDRGMKITPPLMKEPQRARRIAPYLIHYASKSMIDEPLYAYTPLITDNSHRIIKGPAAKDIRAKMKRSIKIASSTYLPVYHCLKTEAEEHFLKQSNEHVAIIVAPSVSSKAITKQVTMATPSLKLLRLDVGEPTLSKSPSINNNGLGRKQLNAVEMPEKGNQRMSFLKKDSVTGGKTRARSNYVAMNSSMKKQELKLTKERIDFINSSQSHLLSNIKCKENGYRDNETMKSLLGNKRQRFARTGSINKNSHIYRKEMQLSSFHHSKPPPRTKMCKIKIVHKHIKCQSRRE